jgi:hypothetical protein
MNNLQELVQEYIEGRNKEVLGQILQLLEPLIRKRAGKLHKLIQEDYEDTKQELYKAIIKHLNRYDPKKGKFITYVFNFINRGDPTDILLSKVCKKRGGDGKRHFSNLPTSLNEVLNEGEDDKNITLEDKIASPINLREEIDDKDIRELIERVGLEKTQKILREELR